MWIWILVSFFINLFAHLTLQVITSIHLFNLFKLLLVILHTLLHIRIHYSFPISILLISFPHLHNPLELSLTLLLISLLKMLSHNLHSMQKLSSKTHLRILLPRHNPLVLQLTRLRKVLKEHLVNLRKVILKLLLLHISHFNFRSVQTLHFKYQLVQIEILIHRIVSVVLWNHL